MKPKPVFAASGASSHGKATPAAVPWVLRVLNGRQSLVETAVAEGRFLVGNDELQSDWVIDTGSEARQLVMLRREEQGFSVVLLSGEAWVGRRPLVFMQAHPLARGEVLTLGRVSMALAPQGYAFSEIEVPTELRQAGDDAKTMVVPFAPRSRSALRMATSLRVAVVATLAVSLGAALVWGTGLAQADRGAGAVSAATEAQLLQSLLDQQGMADARVLSQPNGSFLIEGYVADRPTYERLSVALSRAPRMPLVRLHTVDDLRAALALRFQEGAGLDGVSHVGQGEFRLSLPSDTFERARAVSERAMKDIQGVRSLTLALSDLTVPDTAQPATVRFQRSAERPGVLVVSEIDLPLKPAQRAPAQFVELRLGAVPSVVTRQGERLFAGARLRDGTEIARIDAEGVWVSKGGVERLEPVP